MQGLRALNGLNRTSHGHALYDGHAAPVIIYVILYKYYASISDESIWPDINYTTVIDHTRVGEVLRVVTD